jgi:hypothetical protein
MVSLLCGIVHLCIYIYRYIGMFPTYHITIYIYMYVYIYIHSLVTYFVPVFMRMFLYLFEDHYQIEKVGI